MKLLWRTAWVHRLDGPRMIPDKSLVLCADYAVLKVFVEGPPASAI